MARWLNELDISFAQVDDDEEHLVPEIGPKVAEKIRELAKGFVLEPADQTQDYKDWVESELTEIADRFETALDFEEFNNALNDLYDFGDTPAGRDYRVAFHRSPKLLWVNMMLPSTEKSLKVDDDTPSV